jgi:hypothetical protein
MRLDMQSSDTRSTQRSPIRRAQGTALAAALMTLAASASAADGYQVLRGAKELGGPVQPVIIEKDMARLPEPRLWQPGDPIREMPLAREKGFVPPAVDPRPVDLDPVLQDGFWMPERGPSAFGTPSINVPGRGFSGVNPSDTIGDIGNEHYVQMINGGGGTQVLVLNKNDGSQAAFFILEDLASGSGTGCVNGSGDPIINFDETADNGPGQLPGRWMLTEFTGNSFCVYISQTDDPTTGDWFLYEFISDTGGLPDYPKFGVWPDGYYIGANEGPRQYVLDRENMLQGLTARPPQVFTGPGLPGFGFQHIMPVDWDGDVPPPAGAPGLFVRHRDDEIHNGGSADPSTDIMEIWEFDVDWDNPGNSSFSGPTNVLMAEFDSNFCNLAFAGCLPQPTGSTPLFALLQPIMWRAQYRNFGSHQSLVANMVTDIDGNDSAGVRWFELRRNGGPWSTFQEGTIGTTDGIDRWMASAAMDEAGNIAVGYNVVNDGSGGNIFPGMRYAGRLASDPLGSTPRGEHLIIDGSASNGSQRYGDYSSMNVDPVDGCTFWYTAQFNPSSQWATQIASFRFDACGTPGFVVGSPTGELQVCNATTAAPYAFELDVFQIAGFTNPVTLSMEPGVPAGVTTGFSVNPVTPPGTSELSGTVATSVAGGPYTLSVRGAAAGADDFVSDLVLSVFDQAPAEAVLTAPADGADLVSLQPTLTWTAAAQATTYTLEIATDDQFNTIVYSVDVTGTSHTVPFALDSLTEHFWRVRAANICGPTESVTFRFTTQPAPGDCAVGQATRTVFFDDLEGDVSDWTTGGSNSTWMPSSARTTSGTQAWYAEDLSSTSDQRLISPAITLPTGQLPMSLIYQNYQIIEADGNNCWDAAILEISTDGGASWTQLDNELLSDPYDGTINNTPNPLAGLQGWCGDPEPWVRSVVDLSAFQGESVQFRFRLGTDAFVGREGWYIDDVEVQSCLGENVFSDGFESN